MDVFGFFCCCDASIKPEECTPSWSNLLSLTGIIHLQLFWYTSNSTRPTRTVPCFLFFFFWLVQLMNEQPTPVPRSFEELGLLPPTEPFGKLNRLLKKAVKNMRETADVTHFLVPVSRTIYPGTFMCTKYICMYIFGTCVSWRDGGVFGRWLAVRLRCVFCFAISKRKCSHALMHAV